jgi:phosphoglycerate dehydrogenase-like enzyme
MKLLIWHPAWRLFQPLLEAALQTPWSIDSDGGDLGWLRERLPGADALVALELPRELLPCARRLKALLFPGAGYLHSSPGELPEGCVLANVFEHEIPIAEYVLMAILMHVTRVRRYAASFAAGRWEGNGRTGGEPHGEAYGKTVGLIGYGHIGREVARRARSFGMRILAVRRSQEPLADEALRPDWLGSTAQLDRLLAESDFVIVCCPLTPATRGLLDRQRLARLRDGALLVNVARAEIVEEEALWEELSSGRISAALDVWYRYPSSNDEILHGSRFPFHTLENVLATPHLSAWTQAMLERRMRRLAENLDRLARAEELERVVLRGNWREEAGPAPEARRCG